MPQCSCVANLSPVSQCSLSKRVADRGGVIHSLGSFSFSHSLSLSLSHFDWLEGQDSSWQIFVRVLEVNKVYFCKNSFYLISLILWEILPHFQFEVVPRAVNVFSSPAGNSFHTVNWSLIVIGVSFTPHEHQLKSTVINIRIRPRWLHFCRNGHFTLKKCWNFSILSHVYFFLCPLLYLPSPVCLLFIIISTLSKVFPLNRYPSSFLILPLIDLLIIGQKCCPPPASWQSLSQQIFSLTHQNPNLHLQSSLHSCKIHVNPICT